MDRAERIRAQAAETEQEAQELRAKASEIEQEKRKREREEERGRQRERKKVRQALQGLDERELRVLAEKAATFDHGSGPRLRGAVGKVQERHPEVPALSVIEEVAGDVLQEQRTRRKAEQIRAHQNGEPNRKRLVALVGLLAAILALLGGG